jgi:hypothetical protein
MKARDTNHVMAMKTHYFSFIVAEASKAFKEKGNLHKKEHDIMIYAVGNLGALMMRLYHVNLVLGRSHKTK